jgi:hypothetical protein
MSHYGPPGGPYAGQPQDPWSSRQPQEPYDQPSDPWSDQDPWSAPASPAPASPATGSPMHGYSPPASPSVPDYGQPRSLAGTGQGGGYSPTAHFAQSYDTGYGQQPVHSPVWSQPTPPPPRRKTSGPMLAAVVVLALLVVGGLGVGSYFLLKDDGGTTSSQGNAPATTDTPAPTPSASASGNSGESGGSSTDARFAAKGQCLVNTGTNQKPVMQITKCGAGTYEVLARFDGTKDYAGRCGGGKVPGYQYFYFFDGELDSSDFVLCLRKR